MALSYKQIVTLKYSINTAAESLIHTGYFQASSNGCPSWICCKDFPISSMITAIQGLICPSRKYTESLFSITESCMVGAIIKLDKDCLA